MSAGLSAAKGNSAQRLNAPRRSVASARLTAIAALALIAPLTPFVAPLAAAESPQTPSTSTTTAVLAGDFAALRPGADIPAPWSLQTYAKISRATQFSLVAEGGSTVLVARAEQAAASLGRPLTIDASATPWLHWRWRPLSAPQKSALGERDADDWGARLYVLFDPPTATLGVFERLGLSIARQLHGEHLPARALCYVWLPGGSAGASAPNAYTDRLRMIVVDTGDPGDWRSFTRNVADDYRAAFGEPLAPVSGIAVSADSDNGGGIAETRFGEIVFTATRPTSD